MEESTKVSNNEDQSSQETVPLNNPQQESPDGIKFEPSSVKDEDNNLSLTSNREELISVAVKFLQNSKVKSSSLQLKRSFLLKKGLTEREIQAAFDRAGVDPGATTPHHTGATTPRHNASSSPYYDTPSIAHQMVPHGSYQNTFSSKIREFVNFLVLIGGVSYAINFLWKRYIRPWLYGITNPQPKQVLLTTIQSLLKSVETLKTAVMQLQNSMDKYTEKVDKYTDKVDGMAGDKDGWKQTLMEVKSVKGLMLSSQQFPAHPPTPTIPTWQRLENTENKKIDPDIVVTVDKKDSNGSGSSSEIELIGGDSRKQSSSDEGGALKKQLETC